MTKEQISEKLGIEPFLIVDIKNISTDAVSIQSFLENMYETRKDGNKNVLLILGEGDHDLEENDGESFSISRFKDAKIQIHTCGGIEFSSLNNYYVHSRSLPGCDESKWQPITVVNNGIWHGNFEHDCIGITFTKQKTLKLKDSDSFSSEKYSIIRTEIRLSKTVEIYAITCLSQIETILQEDKYFWKNLADKHKLSLESIQALYTNKHPITPWYKSITQSGTSITMGRCYRVDEINCNFLNCIDSAKIETLFQNYQVIHEFFL